MIGVDNAAIPKCFTHQGEDRDAETFLRNKRETLIPLCGLCYDQFMETCRATVGKEEIWKNHQKWLDRPESERRISLEDGMAEFQEQEQARRDGSRVGPLMTGSQDG